MQIVGLLNPTWGILFWQNITHHTDVFNLNFSDFLVGLFLINICKTFSLLISMNLQEDEATWKYHSIFKTKLST